jgi:hypothetical protein
VFEERVLLLRQLKLIIILEELQQFMVK